MQFRRTFKYRLYPSKLQQHNINNQLELSRQLYNELLNVKKETYRQSHKSLSKYDLNKCMLYFNDNNPDFKLIHSQVKQNISDRVDKAFNNMYARIKRREKKVGYPRIKSKNRYKSICYPQSGYKLTSDRKLKVSKIGEMNIRLHRKIKGDIKTMTILRTFTNKYYASFSCYCKEDRDTSKSTIILTYFPGLSSSITSSASDLSGTSTSRVLSESISKSTIKKKKSVGIDVGLKSFLTTSEGQEIASPQFYRKSEDKLARLQKQHSKKKLGSNNHSKSRLKVALCHEKIAHQRLNFTHKLSHYFIENYSHVGIEDLNVKGMVKNHNLSKSILDAGWSMFYNQLQYKAEYADSEVMQVNRFYPSTKTCSVCGKLNNMPLHKRIYRCECGNVIDRDYNAAINIDNESLRLTKMGQVLPESVGDETSTFEQSKASIVDESGSNDIKLISY